MAAPMRRQTKTGPSGTQGNTSRRPLAKESSKAVKFTLVDTDQSLLQVVEQKLSSAQYNSFGDLCKQALEHFLAEGGGGDIAPKITQKTAQETMSGEGAGEIGDLAPLTQSLTDLKHRLDGLEETLVAGDSHALQTLEKHLSALEQRLDALGSMDRPRDDQGQEQGTDLTDLADLVSQLETLIGGVDGEQEGDRLSQVEAQLTDLTDALDSLEGRVSRPLAQLQQQVTRLDHQVSTGDFLQPLREQMTQVLSQMERLEGEPLEEAKATPMALVDLLEERLNILFANQFDHRFANQFANQFDSLFDNLFNNLRVELAGIQHAQGAEEGDRMTQIDTKFFELLQRLEQLEVQVQEPLLALQTRLDTLEHQHMGSVLAEENPWMTLVERFTQLEQRIEGVLTDIHQRMVGASGPGKVTEGAIVGGVSSQLAVLAQKVEHLEVRLSLSLATFEERLSNLEALSLSSSIQVREELAEERDESLSPAFEGIGEGIGNTQPDLDDLDESAPEPLAAMLDGDGRSPESLAPESLEPESLERQSLEEIRGEELDISDPLLRRLSIVLEDF